MDLSIFEFIFEIAKILCKKNSTKPELFRFLSRSIVSLFTFSIGNKKKKRNFAFSRIKYSPFQSSNI